MAEERVTLSRRSVLAGAASAAASSVAGCSLLERGADGETVDVEGERAARFAQLFAPTLYFDEHEQWFPTDPRPYESEQDGETVVDGFDALDGYAERSEAIPDPIAFYNVVEYEESPLAVVQFWFYSTFDQFTTNFHWHDWELLQVFLDTDTEEPQLYVASSHSRKVPNNEFLDPERQPRILSELGSHSSGLSINEDDQFQRFSIDGGSADVTNSIIEGIDAVADIPLAYGLPRDEGLGLPYAVPELDGAPLYEHDALPSVAASDLVPDELTIRSFGSLASPPDIPERETGVRLDYEATDATDAIYDLQPTADLEHIADFTGPQLSFEFYIPDYAEDVIASHITTTGVPWDDQRYENPASDISEPGHRQALADRYDAIGEPSPFDQVVAGVTSAVSNEDAPAGEGLLTDTSPLELFVLFQSEPEAVPTFRGVAVVQDVPEGEHTLTINGAGVEPHSETVRVSGGGGTTAAGVEGEIPVVAREHSVKLAVDPSEADSDLTDLAVEDDFAGRMYDAPLDGPDAVYVHQGGAYTTEVRDSDDEVGAFRVNPDAEKRVEVEDPQTGKEPLASYVADVATETRDQVAAVEEDSDQQSAVTGLTQALDAVAEAAHRAAENAKAGNRGSVEQNLDTVATRLDRVATRLSEARGSIPTDLARATDNRLDQTRRRTDQAKNAAKL
jgi:hypothetical protein